MTLKIRHIKGHHWLDFRSYWIHMHGTVPTSILFFMMIATILAAITHIAIFIIKFVI